MKTKKASETVAVTTHIVLPNDTNTLGNLFGGQLLAWIYSRRFFFFVFLLFNVVLIVFLHGLSSR